MNRLLTAHTPLGKALWAVSLTGREALSTLYAFTVCFKSLDANIDGQAMIGELCAIELETDRLARRWLSGQMIDFTAIGNEGRHWVYEATVAPKLWHASRRADFRIWQNMTVPDILYQVLGENAVRFDMRLTASYKVWEYLVQYRETDLTFICRQLEHEGIFFWFEHGPEGETLVLADHLSAHPVCPGYAEVPFYSSPDARADEDHFDFWRLARQVEPGRLIHSDYDFKKPSTNLTTEYADPRGHLFDQYERFHYPGDYVEPGDGTQYAANTLERLQRAQETVRLAGRVRGAAPGHRFTLTEHPRKDQNRELTIVAAHYDLADNNYEGAPAEAQSRFRLELEAVPAERPWRAPLATPKPRVRGVETAVVVGPAGSEIHTDEFGRVKVHFHWDRYGKKDGTDTCWIRVAHPWAGTNFGAIHIPRVGQEVIVDFEFGDPDRPIITGRVYNAEQMPPWGLPANKTQSGILTRSSPGGAAGAGLRDGAGDANALRFEDKAGAEQVWFHAQKDYLTEVENDESKWVGRDRHKEIDRDETTEVHRHRTETVDGNETITVHMNRTEVVDLDETITIHKNRSERVDLNEKVDIGVNRTMIVGRNEKLTVGTNKTDKIGKNWSLKTGKMKTETIGIANIENVGVARMTNIGAGYSLNVGVMMNTLVGMQQATQVGAKKSLKVGDTYAADIGKTMTLAVGETKTETVGKTSIQSAGEELVIGSGAAKIVLKRDGTIELGASHIELLASDAINADAGLVNLDNGAGDGVADKPSACSPAVGSPVNPVLGVKLLPGETDFALPAPAPFAFTRMYLSSDARIGVLGQGWSIPGDGLGLEVNDQATVLIDAQGRRITFGPLAPGEARFSPSERLWIRRGGPVIPQREALADWTGRWAAVPVDVRHDPACVFVATGGVFHQFCEMAGQWHLAARFDRNGYRTAFAWAGLPNGQRVPVRVIDSVGRHYGLTYGQVSPTAAHDPGVRLVGVALLEGAESAIPRMGDEHTAWLVRYDYSAAGDLIAVRNRSDQVVRTFAWQQHIMVGHAIPGGLEMRYEWDRFAPDGKVVRQIEADGLTRTFHYHADHTTVTDSLGRADTYHFEGEGPDTRWSAHTRADGSRIEHQHDGFGRRVAEVDPLGRPTRMHLDGEGRLVGRTLPDGSRWQYRLDPDSGEPLAIEGPGGTLTITRDARANPLVVTGPDGATTRYTYDDPTLPDRPTTLTDAKGGVRTLQWNRLGQLIAHTDCSGHTSRFKYDAEGQLVAETNALGETTRSAYDRLGRLSTRTDAAGHSTAFDYDALGRLLAVTRPDGTHESLAWDRANRLLAHTNAAGLTQRFQYDSAGRLLALINENGATSRFAYDVMDRIASETGFDGRIQHYTYDAAGALLTRSEASLPGAPLTHYAHDALGRLVTRHLPATEHAAAITETFQWRADGQLSGFASPAATVRFGFDAAGRTTHEAQTHADGWVYHVAQAYDLLGSPASTTLGEAPTLNWLSYGAGHLHGVRIGNAALDFSRDSLHRETERVAHDASGDLPILTEARRYTALGQLASTRIEPAAGAPRERRYQHTPLGLISAIADSAVGTIAYTYDGAERLIGSTHGPHTHTYRFDAAGNRLDPAADPKRRPNAEEWARIVQERLHDPNFNPLEEYGIDAANPRCMDNRISVLAGTRNRYDGAGNLIEQVRPDGTRLALGYDGAHRLVHLVRTDSDGQRTTATYTYDALSRRIAKSVTDPSGHTTTRYGWEGERLVCEDNGTTRNTVFHTPGSFVPLLQVEAPSDADDDETRETRHLLSEVATLMGAHGLALPEALRPEPKSAHIRFFHTDHLGTPLQLIDTAGRIHWQASPDDWRAVRDQHGARQPIRFQGQWEDEESGLYYNRYRYYDPGMGRYVTQDPIGLAGGANVSNYVFASPVNYIDAYGLEGNAVACYRPLGPIAPVTEFILPSPGGRATNTVIAHQHVFYSDGTNVGFDTRGIYDHTDPLGTENRNAFSFCHVLGTDTEVRTAVDQIKEKERWQKGSYMGVGNNCQSFVSDVGRQVRRNRFQSISDFGPMP